MKPLIKYELMKILRRKATVVIMLVSLIVTIFLFALPVLQFQTYNEEGVMKGLDGIAFKKTQDVSEKLTDAYVTAAVNDVKALFQNPENVGYDGTEQFLIGSAYWEGIAPRESMLDLIASAYVAPGESAGYNSLPDLDISAGANFYQARDKKIQMLLDDPSRELSDAQKDYWLDMNSHVNTPLEYGYHESWEIILTSFELLMFALLAVCIVIAPVFAGEYQAGTDAVILAAKYGKTKLIRAKIIASMLFGMAAFTVHIIAAFGIVLAAFGFDGWHLPVQILSITIPYPWTMLEAVLINLGIVYLVLLAMISLTLLLSAKMKSPYFVLIILVPVLFLPMFFVPDGTSGIYNLVLFLMPYRSVIPEIGKYISYQLGGAVSDIFLVRAILYAVLVLILLPFARLGFKKHQVS